MNFIALFTLTTTCCLASAQTRGWDCSPGRRMLARGDKRMRKLSSSTLSPHWNLSYLFLNITCVSQGLRNPRSVSQQRSDKVAEKKAGPKTQMPGDLFSSRSVSWSLLPPGAQTFTLHHPYREHDRNLKQATCVILNSLIITFSLWCCKSNSVPACARVFGVSSGRVPHS